MEQLMTPDQLCAQIQAELGQLPSHLRTWTERHLITPREVRFWSDPDRRSSIELWLLTDHVGGSWS
jgi:hypothetical protein